MNLEEWAMVMEGSGTRDGASYLGGLFWGSNQRGFSLLPAGEFKSQNITHLTTFNLYENIKTQANHWFPGEYKSSDSTLVGLCGNTAVITQDQLARGVATKKVNGLSVRCVQDY